MKVLGKGTTLAGETYQDLRARILRGDIAPGTRVRTNELCTRFDVSLAAVREALTQLMAEGLVISEPHRGYTVAPISVTDLEDLTRVRIQIENLCLVWSIEHGELEWETGVIAATHRLSKTLRAEGRASPNPAWAQAHDTYHAALVSACGSPRLLQIRRQLYEQSERYRRLEAILSKSRGSDDRDADAEHASIAEAVLARDTPRATRLMKEHISLTAQRIVQAMSRKKRTAATLSGDARRRDGVASWGNSARERRTAMRLKAP